ncbi:hypothetical protein ACFR9U_00710 [Halorientalis brevis]|uniref:Uncharacterized protein n=1 Tax=Halorientalis brevis TaxID=1126241 RepID=A0ABD6C6L4_9EURY|nr:hypothetical protein [Halorientalis brevis]
MSGLKIDMPDELRRTATEAGEATTERGREAAARHEGAVAHPAGRKSETSTPRVVRWHRAWAGESSV